MKTYEKSISTRLKQLAGVKEPTKKNTIKEKEIRKIQTK